jgi:hypothetical protein
MKRFGPAAAALAAALSCCGATGARAQTSPFDGHWSIQVFTDRGACDRASRYPVVVQNGQVRYGGPEALKATGQVASNGAVRGSLVHGANRAYVTGRLGGPFGQGTWTTSGANACAGRWNAEKRG